MRHLSTSSFKLFFWNVFRFLAISIVAVVISFEIYNPVKKKIGSENANLTRTFDNSEIASLPKKIFIKYNNIGFFGEDYADTIKRKKILFLGSSTTQCFYIPVENKWTSLSINQQNYWSNNCGVDGSRITGFSDEVKALSLILPDYIIILLDPFHDDNLVRELDRKTWLLKILNSSELFKHVIKPYYVSKLKVNQKIGHKSANWSKEVKANPKNYFPVYRFVNSTKLLDQLTQTIKDHGAIPIYISNPTPYGNYIDLNKNDISKVEGSLAMDSLHAEFSSFIEGYCELNKVPFINGYKCPKGTEYFYDFSHFSIQGSLEFANCIKPALERILNPKP